MQPRSRVRMESASITLPASIHAVEPLGYHDFLCMQANAGVVLTDSGGIQEETTVLQVPCLTLRDNTERPVTVECGTNCLAGTKRDSIVRAWKETLRNPKIGATPP